MESKFTQRKFSKTWSIDGHHHRVDGPAVIWDDGDEEWHINGKWHRLDGPAVKFGPVTVWFINGVKVDTEIKLWASELGIDLNNLTEYDKNLIAMKWSEYGK